MSTIDYSRFLKSIKSPALLGAALIGTALPAVAQTYPVNILETARTAPQEWAYTFTQPGDEWIQVGYDDALWNHGPSGFGTKSTPGAVVSTEWNGTDIWMRKTITVTGLADKSGLTAIIHHDENVEIYVNGKKIFGLDGYTIRYESNFLDLESVNAFKEGDNIIAIHCRQTIGGQYIDLGLVEYKGGLSTDFVLPSYSGAQEWRYATEDPQVDWTAPDFNDASWPTGKSGFGAGGDYGSAIQTAWTTENIYLRTTFDVKSAAKVDNLILGLTHDDEVTVWLNGQQVADITGYNASSFLLDISTPGKKALKDGANILAVKCHNVSSTPQFVDVSLMGLGKDEPVALRARSAAAPPARVFSWRPGHSRLLIGAGARLVDLSGRSAH